MRTLKAESLRDGSKKKYFVFAGTSSETKPVNNLISSGSWFHEVDTAKVYAYNEEASSGEEWVEHDRTWNGFL